MYKNVLNETIQLEAIVLRIQHFRHRVRFFSSRGLFDLVPSFLANKREQKPTVNIQHLWVLLCTHRRRHNFLLLELMDQRVAFGKYLIHFRTKSVLPI